MRNFLRWVLAIPFWFVIVSILWVLLLGAIDPPVTWVMVDQAAVQGGVKREQRGMEHIARSLPLAIIASEDQRFMRHRGFEWNAIERAMKNNKKGKRVKGASTISQQTAKNVFLWPGRNWLRKGLEVWFTVLIETFWTKERILEVYLNVAEMGKGVFGAEAAAQHCFDRPASKLTVAQAALITATLPSPRRFNCARPSGYIKGRQQWTMRQMRNIGDVLDPEVRERQRIAREKKEARSRKRKK